MSLYNAIVIGGTALLIAALWVIGEIAERRKRARVLRVKQEKQHPFLSWDIDEDL